MDDSILCLNMQYIKSLNGRISFTVIVSFVSRTYYAHLQLYFSLDNQQPCICIFTTVSWYIYLIQNTHLYTIQVQQQAVHRELYTYTYRSIIQNANPISISIRYKIKKKQRYTFTRRNEFIKLIYQRNVAQIFQPGTRKKNRTSEIKNRQTESWVMDMRMRMRYD